jgi:hypothetical protein
MTITAQTSKTGPYNGNGTTTVFSYTFEVQDEAHLVVTLADASGVETVQVLNTDYTVSGVGNPGGGQITMTTAPAASYTLTISRNVPITQEVDLENRRSVAPEVLEDAYDKLTQIAQDLNEQVGRSLKISVTESGTPNTSLQGDVVPGSFLGFGIDGNFSVLTPPSGTFISAGASLIAVDAFTGDGTTVDFTMGGIPAGAGNVFVFLDGVMQDAVNYSVSGTTLTFSTAPPLNTNIEVRRFQSVSLSPGATTADLVTYSPAGSGAVNTTVEAKLRQYVSVKDFGAVGDGVTDDTAAIQAAIDYGVLQSNVVFMPSGNYLVTDTLDIPMYTQIKGEHHHQNSVSYGVQPKGTKITFAPTTAKTLFQASGPKLLGGFYRSSYLIEGLYLSGNSTDASGNSVYALDIDSITYSSFRDLAIDGFRTGIRVYASINNRFEHVHIANAYIQNVLYDGGTSTTDVWDQCTFHYAPIGLNFSGVTIGCRFTECLFEGLEDYGVNIAKESFGHMFSNCYAEDVPSTANANGAMFRVGHDGTTLTVSNALTVIGGYYGGRNAGAIGSFVDADFASSIMIANPLATRYTNGIKTSANTYIDSVIVSGMQVTSITNIVTDFTKVNGLYPHAQLGISGAEHRLRTPVIFADEIRERTSGAGVLLGSTTACPVQVATTGGSVGFYGTTPISKPTITGSRGGNAALANLLTQLAALGLITDSTT